MTPRNQAHEEKPGGSLFKAQYKLYLPWYQMKLYNQKKQIKAEGGTSLVEMRNRSLWIIEIEKAMAPHSSTLAWKIPWTEEPGGLQSMGSLRVGHD